MDDAVEVLAGARRTYGDTFTVRSGEDTYLFTFSPTGVTSFYQLPEDAASKGVAACSRIAGLSMPVMTTLTGRSRL